MASSSPGSARAISGRGTGLTPGPGSMPPTGANHGCRLATGTGQTRQVRGRNRRAVRTRGAGCAAGEKCRARC